VNTKNSASFDLEVLPANPEVLSQVCQRLALVATEASTLTEAIDASLALSYVNDPVAVQYLKETLKRGSSMVRMYAVSGLGKIGNQDAVETLILTLNSPDPDLSAFVRTVLRAVKTRVNDPKLRREIESALRDPK